MKDTNNVLNEIQLVVFDLASEHYGVDISDVREIMRMQTITKVPGALSCVEGVINLRGKVLPVMDLRKRLELKAVDKTEDSRIVIIDISTGQVGVIVDAVTEVLRVENASIDPPSTMISHGKTDYLKGIAKLSDRLIILLDLRKLLSQKAISDTIKLAEESQGKIDEKEAPVTTGNGNKKKAAELTDKINTKEYVVT